MPTNRKRVARQSKPFQTLPEIFIKFFFYGWDDEESENEDLVILSKEELQKIWQENKVNLLQIWFKDKNNLFKRPYAWWRYENVGRRERVCGNGISNAEKYQALIPAMSFGIPESWYTYDEENPPMFEGEAVYLRGSGLLTPLEKNKLKAKDLEPVSILEILGGNL